MRLERALRARQLIPLAAIWLLVGCGKQETVESTAVPPEVGVYTVKAQALTLTTDLPGRTSAYRVSEVRPQASGILQKRMFVEGAEVKQGEQLYQIDPRTYEALLARAEASLLTAQNLARRYERLLDTNAISQQQYDDAMATWKQAQAEAQMARINMQYTKVLAPITGRIGRSAVTEGALVTNGQAQELATVTQLDPIYVDVNQPITRLLGLKRALESGRLQRVGDNQAQVSLTLDDGTPYPLKGVLKFSEVSVAPSTGSVTLRAEFPNPDHKLLPGMFVHALLNEGEQQAAILVPHQAVGRDARGVPTVWVVKPDNTVESREVQTLQTVGNAWLLGAGINDGERVITEGVQLARSGITVKPVAAKNVKLMSEFGSQVQAQAH
ncbi:toluene efflux RND transporter periplasmic adaptor subunit TtgD [Pseudomonas asiatica]|uniref:Toluene efflux pump periplasmic linker protein TtgD n=3 Tax=Pseudomonas putida group TaxID=136845 RepID=TTGD_PSEPT|nr:MULTISPECIES: toluene efflux RND transporter periplasmic adaptor subunit TtgD [Pseudomonas]Q849Q9.1 RecName: Full=Probable efflux pump periplasmic linker protein SepA; Flags: Precursor [Pseudomonas putida F1]Q9KWV5.2 RecName: Full=Toluene efflux pump periplasmic linker protein TtgD; Flags: Precursor [Pseudomonas putida DOT-T1E]AAO49780.1 inner membrane efflux protein SepA [Pseudomonas putida]AHC82471.1 hemolysin D [Pseudomonas monteilii SB3078]AHC87850.1 hemolysin D [Pseudomonas monteilii S